MYPEIVGASDLVDVSRRRIWEKTDFFHDRVLVDARDVYDFVRSRGANGATRTEIQRKFRNRFGERLNRLVRCLLAGDSIRFLNEKRHGSPLVATCVLSSREEVAA